MKFFVMITTRLSDRYTDYALRSFFATTPLDPEDRFFLIDNDLSFEPYRANQLRQTELIRNPQPLGFAENVNQVLRQSRSAKADLYILNNDLIFSRDWILPLLSDDEAILSPLSNREVRYETDFFSTTISMELSQYTGHEAAFEKLVQAHRYKFSGYLEVMILPFFCAKIPWTVQNRLGCLDPKFGKGGGEDYDYCLRAQLAGYQVRFAQQSYILHFGSKSFSLGGESASEQRQRENSFISFLREKWGERLAQLTLSDSDNPLEDDLELAALLEKKKFREIIERLKPAQGPLVRIN